MRDDYKNDENTKGQSRRDFIKKSVAAGVGVGIAGIALNSCTEEKMRICWRR